MKPLREQQQQMTRRQWLSPLRGCLGAAALATLDGGVFAQPVAPHSGQGLADLPHFRPRAKRVISLFMAGGPSHIDLFDYKPEMEKINGIELPESIRQGQRLTTMTSGQTSFTCVAPMFQFKQVGERGTWINPDVLPHTAKVADEIAIIRSMNTEAINHDPAITYINTGRQQPGRPSFGSWISYGLGSINQNLPAYVVFVSVGAMPGQALFSRLWGSGFLASRHQGVQFRGGREPVLYLSNPPGIAQGARRKMLDGIARLNAQNFQRSGDPEIQTRISQYELAFRMQTSIPELMDVSDETESTLDLYGPNARKPGTFAANCLLARRLAERGVPFVQLFHRGWDQHGNLPANIKKNGIGTDQPAAALLQDLKRRGLLDDTIVIFGGEFGRTIYSQGKVTVNNHGRDHHGRCFSTWIAGGGFRPGIDYGKTDDFAYNVVQDPVHINDLNATILHNLGIDHQRFSVKYQGLDVRLTGVEGAHVVNGLLA
ncbi:MAG: DUF1501 domain-containing protein [Planctomycetota bacterium]|nr:DUF1501 domain-containing protein [Planctomycetota bacterium]